MKWIAKAGFRKGARAGKRVTVASAGSLAESVVVNSEVVGHSVRLTLRSYSDGRPPRVGSASAVLQALATPFLEHGQIAGDAPLAELLAFELKAGGRPFVTEVYARLANGIVLSHELIGPDQPVWPRPDAPTTPGEAMALAALPWPEWLLEIQASDPAWIGHFPTEPYALDRSRVQPAAAWEGPLLLFKGSKRAPPAEKKPTRTGCLGVVSRWFGVG